MTVAHLESLKKLLVEQYMLHEVQHWAVHTHTHHTEGQPESTAREPRAHTPLDIYKCLHQGEYGVGHLVGDPIGFWERLGRELLASPPVNEEPLLETVATNGGILRVNLRPFRALFDDETDNACNLLTDVCLASSAISIGNAESFLSKLQGFRDLNESGRLTVGHVTYAFAPEMIAHFLKKVRDLTLRLGDIWCLATPRYIAV